jgi:ElaB/YqjD/DUF883 family membrane-anchored ribosome-binding protein
MEPAFIAARLPLWTRAMEGQMPSTDTMRDIRDIADSATFERLQKDVSSVKKDIAALADQIAETISHLGGAARRQAKQGYKQAQANVDAAMGDVAERGDAWLGAAQDAAATIEETLEDAIAQRPLTTVGLALGLGFLIGMAWRR